MPFDCDALIIGAGAAGACTAILLAQAGWRVALVEQHTFPRRKVCGECIAAGNLVLLDTLGVGAAFRRAAGPELRRIGWMDATTTLTADMPACTTGPYAFGRALGRDRLDVLLVDQARTLGVEVLQPARVQSVSGEAGRFDVTVTDTRDATGRSGRSMSLRAPVVIDAHGSWERAPDLPRRSASARRRGPGSGSDLFGFKANFSNSTLACGFLPLLVFPGGYGGMVIGDGGRMTLACCLRRDALTACRALAPHAQAGPAVEALLRRSCKGVREVLNDAALEQTWLSVGPLRPGVRVDHFEGVFRVGNAAGESHPLIGEGITMALQSAALLAALLGKHDACAIGGIQARSLHLAYAAAWRRAFAPRLRLAAAYAQLAMRPALAGPAKALISRWPSLLRGGARLAGKAACAAHFQTTTTEAP